MQSVLSWKEIILKNIGEPWRSEGNILQPTNVGLLNGCTETIGGSDSGGNSSNSGGYFDYVPKIIVTEQNHTQLN